MIINRYRYLLHFLSYNRHRYRYRLEPTFNNRYRLEPTFNNRYRYRLEFNHRSISKGGEGERKRLGEQDKRDENEQESRNQIRQVPGTSTQLPANKKRKIKYGMFKKVMQMETVKEKRHHQGDAKENSQKRRRIGPLDD